MNKVCFLIVWFGKWPSFFDLFLNSCSYQTGIDFYFISDNVLPNNVSKNVKWKYMSLTDFNAIASYRTNAKINVARGYKICDLKPAWCHIFEDVLLEYEYVGYCDIDLVFGDILSFIEPLTSGKVDLYTVTDAYCSGATTLFRNTPEMRVLYRKAKSWQMIFEDSENYAFDEMLLPSKRDSGYDTFSDVVKNEELTNGLKVYWGHDIMLEIRPISVIVYDKGHVHYCDKEWIAFHYVIAKNKIFWTFPKWKEIPSLYLIGKYGFYLNENKPISKFQLLYNNDYRSQIYKTIMNKSRRLYDFIRRCSLSTFIDEIRRQF